MKTHTPHIIILYDGQCIMCQYFARYIGLKKRYDIQLYDMHTHPHHIATYRKQGYDIYQGMIIDIDGVVYHGAMALTILHELIQSGRRWQDLCIHMVSNKSFARFIYPLLLGIRKITTLGS